MVFFFRPKNVLIIFTKVDLFLTSLQNITGTSTNAPFKVLINAHLNIIPVIQYQNDFFINLVPRLFPLRARRVVERAWVRGCFFIFVTLIEIITYLKVVFQRRHIDLKRRNVAAKLETSPPNLP